MSSRSCLFCDKRQAEEGTAVAEVCQKEGISEASFYTWRSKYGGMEVSDARKLKTLEEEKSQAGEAVG